MSKDKLPETCIDCPHVIENIEEFEDGGCAWYECKITGKMLVKDSQCLVKDGDLISRQSVITMLNKIENAVEDGDGFQFNEWIEYAKDIPSAEKTTINSEKTTITDGDLISRQAVLDRWEKLSVRGRTEFDQVIMMLPSAEKTAEWIPVSERLPEESLNSVIGWDAYRERCVFVQFIDGHFQITGKNESFDIQAWMPLPKPYKAESEEEE